MQAGACGVDDGSQLDVLVVYTEVARLNNGGLAGMDAFRAFVESQANLAYSNSGITTRVRIVGALEVNYIESGSIGTDLVRLSTPDDGYLDEVLALRDDFEADLVALLVNRSNACGVAHYAVGPGNTPIPTLGFSAIAISSCPLGMAVFAHELGHNQGCMHDRDSSPGDFGAFLYSHGHKPPEAPFRTIMALGCVSGCPRVDHFSNPDILFGGVPTGVPEGEPDSANNALTINNTALNVASFRQSSDCNNNGICDAQEIASGQAADCNGNGRPDDCEPDCNANGVLDRCDVDSGTSADCNGNGMPDVCEPDCNGSGKPDECDIVLGLSADCNTNRVPDECELAGNDCDVNGVPDECDPDCDGNGVPDPCEPAFNDCDLNGVPDECDPDCDGDGVPDQCEPTLNDCDANGVPDECDLDCNDNGVADGCELFGNDCNLDGVPDECGVRLTCLEAEIPKLTASDAAAGDWFGQAVSVSGNTAVVGAYVDDCAAGINCGAAYVYRFNGSSWTEEQKLTASDAAEEDFFGYSVSISGDTAVVGAYYDDCAAGRNCGSAYVFRFDGVTWVETQKLTAHDATEVQLFGISVSLSGSTIIVGAYRDSPAPGVRSGSAYVYDFNGASWIETQKLAISDPSSENDYFGFSVSVSGDTAVVGAYQDDCQPASIAVRRTFSVSTV